MMAPAFLALSGNAPENGLHVLRQQCVRVERVHLSIELALFFGPGVRAWPEFAFCSQGVQINIHLAHRGGKNFRKGLLMLLLSLL